LLIINCQSLKECGFTGLKEVMRSLLASGFCWKKWSSFKERSFFG